MIITICTQNLLEMLSIIVPVYNAASYLDRCLLSVASQKCSDWECVVVDDGSTDGSGDICQSWVKRDKRFVYVYQENSGVSVARNKALSMSSGEWVAFVDADDWLDEDYVSVMMDNCGDCDLVVSGQVREYKGRQEYYAPDSTARWTLDECHALDFNELNERFLLYAPHEKFFRSDIIKSHKLCFDPNCSYGEDLQFVYAYMEHIGKIGTVAKAMYHYRMSDGNTLSTKLRYDQFDVDYRQWKIVHDFYVNHGLIIERANVYLYKRLWGIVYDGLFLSLRLKQVSWKYINTILTISEIKDLRCYKHVFDCAVWIKYSILCRLSFVWYFYFMLQKKLKLIRKME